jgi:hypothetical protein
MTHISRRHLPGIGLAVSLALLTTVALAQERGKPEVKWSEAKPIIMEYVEKMSADYKKSTGVEFTVEQKLMLVNSIIANMEAQNIYAFVDP